MLEVEPTDLRGHVATRSGRNVLEAKTRRQCLKNQEK